MAQDPGTTKLSFEYPERLYLREYDQLGKFCRDVVEGAENFMLSDYLGDNVDPWFLLIKLEWDIPEMEDLRGRVSVNRLVYVLKLRVVCLINEQKVVWTFSLQGVPSDGGILGDFQRVDGEYFLERGNDSLCHSYCINLDLETGSEGYKNLGWVIQALLRALPGETINVYCKYLEEQAEQIEAVGKFRATALRNRASRMRIKVPA